MPLVRRNALPGVPDWLPAVPAAQRTGFEAFTSLSQAIGDTAHQYRGHHFVSAVAFIGEQNLSLRAPLLEDARSSLEAARTLWQIAAQELDEGEEPLKYRFWMASSIALHEIIEAIASDEEVRPLEHYEAVVDEEVRELAKDARSGNPFAVAQQLTQLRELHARSIA